MAIDNCEHTFQQLAKRVLPRHMRRMRRAMKKAIPMRLVAQDGKGARALLELLGAHGNFPGCYVLVSRNRPIYVGISRSVASRITQHIKGRTHFDASLAYRMAFAKMPHDMPRSVAMRRPKFKKAFNNAKAYLSKCSVAAIQIDNALERHFFEAYCAMRLDTHRWNTFETH